MKEITSFDIRNTNIAKGVAILMLLAAHLFYYNPERFGNYISVYTHNGVPLEAYFSLYFKVCVAIFVFLSGYGLYFSFNKFIKDKSGVVNYVKGSVRWVIIRLIKLMSDYWIVFIIMGALGFAFNRSPIEIYEGKIQYFIIDFFGIAKIFDTPTLNSTWWFMSLIIILYLFYPLIFKIAEKNELLIISVTFALTIFNFYDPALIRVYLFPMTLGMIFAKENMFGRISNRIEKKGSILSLCKTALPLVILIAMSFIFRRKFMSDGNKMDGLICVPIILLCYLVISRLKFIDVVFEKFGKYSGLLFMLHSFVNTYLNDFLFSFKYTVVIYIVEVTISFVIAFLIEKLEKLIRYDKLINLIIKKI